MNKLLFEKLQAGRKRYQAERTKKRLVHEQELFNMSFGEIGILSNRELFVAGVVLYWAEGFKHRDESGLGLATLDPKMANFYVNWLEKCLMVDRKDLLLRVTANISHIDRIDEMEEFWSKKLNVDLNQFRKPFYQRSKQTKKYDNFKEYYGVIRIRVRRSLNLLRKMRGWMAGLAIK